jgi:hypothetical protein
LVVPDAMRSFSGAGGRLSALARHVGVVAVFTIPSVVLLWHAWDGHVGSAATCACGDSGQLVWFMAWFAYALAHGVNPFFSPMLWAPHGVNLLANESSPLAGMVLAPVTWLWGPVTATNVALTLAPALSAWSCWWACRRLVSSRWAPWVAGALYGFSPFVVASVRQGHLGLAAVFVPPLMLVALDALLLRQQGPPWRPGLALGLLVVVQFLLAPDVLAMTGVVALVGVVVLAAVAIRSLPARLAYAARGAGVAAAVAAVVGGYPVVFALAGPRHVVGAVWPGLNAFGDSLSAVVETGGPPSAAHTLLFGAASQPAANLGLTGPNAAYLGWAVLVAALVAVLLAWRRPVTWALASAGAVASVLSWGSAGFRHDALASASWLPWQSLTGLPVLDDVLPGRFVLFTDLAAAVLLAVGLDQVVRRMRRAGWADALVSCAVGALVLVPLWTLYPLPAPSQLVTVPPWFSTAGRSVPRGSVVLTYPFPASASLASEPLLWQAEDDMGLALAGGYVKVPGTGGHVLQMGAPGSAVDSLITLSLAPQTPDSSWAGDPDQLAALHRALSAWHVSYVVVTATGTNPRFAAAVMTAVTGRLPQVSHRAWVWRLSGAAARPFDAVSASDAFGWCRAKGAVFGPVPGRGPLSQQGDLCVARMLSGGSP